MCHRIAGRDAGSFGAAGQGSRHVRLGERLVRVAPSSYRCRAAPHAAWRLLDAAVPSAASSPLRCGRRADKRCQQPGQPVEVSVHGRS